MAKPIISQEYLKSILHYDQETGVFTRLVSVSNNTKAGDVAGCLDQGYILITINGVRYQAHRLAWLYVYGDLPSGFLDHIDGAKGNNKISNLRLATNAQNKRNVGLCSANTSGYKGVTWVSTRGKFKASCKVFDKQYHLGYFDDAELAANVYQVFSRDNHQEFYRAA